MLIYQVLHCRVLFYDFMLAVVLLGVDLLNVGLLSDLLLIVEAPLKMQLIFKEKVQYSFVNR